MLMYSNWPTSILETRNNKINIITTIRRKKGYSSYTLGVNLFVQKNRECGFSGSLLFQNNINDIEPSVFAQHTLSKQYTQRHVFAVNPVYLHPYTRVQKILGLWQVYHGRVFLIFIAGTSLSEMEAIDGVLPHDSRYDRREEYINSLWHLPSSNSSINLNRRYYTIRNLKVAGTLKPELLPAIFIAGSSLASTRIRNSTHAKKLEMAETIEEVENSNFPKPSSIDAGLVTEPTREEVLEKLENGIEAIYKDNAEMLEVFMENTDSKWKNDLLSNNDEGGAIYILAPFKHLKADCPYLVVSFQEVEEKYVKLGSHTFIIECDQGELSNLNTVVTRLRNHHN